MINALKAVSKSVFITLSIVGLLFIIFSNFHINVGEEDVMGIYIESKGGFFPAMADYIIRYTQLQSFEFNITAYMTGRGTFQKHLLSTINLVVATLTFLVLTIFTLAFYRVKHRKKGNILGSILSGISTIHSLIFLAAVTLIFKAVDLPFWGFIFIIAISNSIFKEFYTDINSELDRIINEKYVQRAVAWGDSRVLYALPDMIISFSRLLTSKIPLLLSATFIIEFFSPNNSGLASDLILGIAEHDYFLVMSATGVFVFITTLLYNLGKLPAIMDPR
ncbi:MAG: hypothetical protein HN936_04365 [Bacteroidetes bacterium]|nr:hypothetical protein [Bacteroidota bacterium]